MGRANAPAANIMLAEFDGESVLLNVDSGQYFSLNEAGCHLWRLSRATSDVPSLVIGLMSEYGISEEVARKDVGEFISCLEDNGLWPAA
jgi:hypothetical protein